MGMFQQTVASDTDLLQAFCHALQSGHETEVERLFNQYLSKTISIRDTFVKHGAKENFYHGLLLGILGCNGRWFVTSNQETGEGYCDILIRIESADVGIIIEVKYAENGGFESACQDALRQINTKDYTAVLKEDGYAMIHKYGIACFRKKCRVALVTEKTQFAD
jgi:Holliday junction resolvase-like predicted endonuclease